MIEIPVNDYWARTSTKNRLRDSMVAAGIPEDVAAQSLGFSQKEGREDDEAPEAEYVDDSGDAPAPSDDEENPDA